VTKSPTWFDAAVSGPFTGFRVLDLPQYRATPPNTLGVPSGAAPRLVQHTDKLFAAVVSTPTDIQAPCIGGAA
jgi:hypothetical protein